jgi:hypothetical protein
LRDDKGKIIQTFVRKMGIDSNNAMELSFPKEGLGIFNMEKGIHLVNL